ncbi:hypothetical protein [Entomobacter blattae]|nr:hypothetical protein [Entomobacter blattae]
MKLDHNRLLKNRRFIEEINIPSESPILSEGMLVSKFLWETLLLTLLPTGHKLNAEFYVSSTSIGVIKERNPVLLRYAAYPYQKFGLYHGIVTDRFLNICLFP